MSPKDASQVLSKIGLYAPKVQCPLLNHLHNKLGYKMGDPCPLSVLNKLDNMNYYGSTGTLELLDEIQHRLKTLHPKTTPDHHTPTKPLSIIDVGSGYGGTSRVLLSVLPRTSHATAIEIQSSVHNTAQILTRAAVAAGDVPPEALHHVRGDATDPHFTLSPTDCPAAVTKEGVDAVVCRLCALHLPRDKKEIVARRMAEWLGGGDGRGGGVIAFEDYADAGLSDAEWVSLERNVAVPSRSLFSTEEWKEYLMGHGFVNVVVEDMTASWARFVKERYEEAELRPEETDERYGGSERRAFFKSVCDLFNPPQGERGGLMGVRVYATLLVKD